MISQGTAQDAVGRAADLRDAAKRFGAETIEFVH